MFMEHTFPPELEGGRLAVIVRLAREMQRCEIEAAVVDLIGELDARDGDPDAEEHGDVEPNGDEKDAGSWR